MPLPNIIPYLQLGVLREELKGRSVVLGTGCFDLLHVGHLYFLQEAKKQGDVLVIGLNSDLSVRAIKGSSRPIIPEEQRARLLSAFNYVDYVFTDDNLAADEAIQQLQPDVFVIGEQSVGTYSSEVSRAKSIGARVHVITRIPSISTTDVVESISKKYEKLSTPSGETVI